MLAHVPGHDPVIELRFDEAVGSTAVTDSAAAGGVITGAFRGDTLPQIRAAPPSPAGGNYVHFEGGGVFALFSDNRNTGGRIELSELLNPILGNTSSLSYYIRTSQTGFADVRQSPGVTGADEPVGGSDVFWGNLGPAGEARVVAGNGAGAASSPISDGNTWYHVTHTRNADTGVVRSYVNGLLVSQATGEIGLKGANFRSIGATTNVGSDLTTVQGYTHLNGDIDQLEIFDRELTPAEVVRFYGAPMAAVPASPGPVTAVADTPTQVTLAFTDVAGEAGYVIRRSAAAGGPFTDLAFLAPDETTYIDRDLTQGTPYFYQVVAFNQSGESAPAAATATTPSPSVDPVIVYDFNENAGTTAEDVSGENNDIDAVLSGDLPPQWRAADPSPAGGSYLHFEGDGLFNGTGGRVGADQLLNPILGRTATLAYYVRTEQVGAADAGRSPGVTGAKQAGGADDIFWGNLDSQGRARVQAGDANPAVSMPLPGAGWVRVVHTRNLETGRVRTFVNAIIVSENVSDVGNQGASFRAIGATTNVAGDLTTVQGYTHLNGDLDQVEIYDRELTAQEVAQRYGPPATAPPASPAPVTAVANWPVLVTVSFTNVANEAGYIISRAPETGGTFTQVGVVGPDVTSFVDASAAHSTAYRYRVTAFNAAGNGNPATTGLVVTPFPFRDPVIVYNFEDAPGGARVNNTGTAGDTYDAVLAGERRPTFAVDRPSPAGGQYLRFTVAAPGSDPAAPTFHNTGGRVDAASLLNPVMGGSASIAYYLRTTQAGHSDHWRSPGISGADQAGGGNDIFWGNLDAQGRARVVAGSGAASDSGLVNYGHWVHVVHTRNAISGIVRTYVNGVLAREATSEGGQKAANFYSFGATTGVADDLTAVTGYNYLDGDLDKIEVYDRELTAAEVTGFYGGDAYINAIYVRGTAWSQSFKSYLEFQGLGGGEYGYRVDNRTGNQAILPWTNVNEIVVSFARPTAGGPAPGTVVLDGNRDGGDYAVTAVTVSPFLSHAYILTLNRPLGSLSTGGENGVRVQMTVRGAGPGGTDYSLRLNALQGDVNRSGSVVAADFSDVKNRFFRTTGAPGPSGPQQYTAFHDVNGDGSILADDFSAVKARFFDTLHLAPAAASARVGAMPITKDVLFRRLEPAPRRATAFASAAS